MEKACDMVMAGYGHGRIWSRHDMVTAGYGHSMTGMAAHHGRERAREGGRGEGGRFPAVSTARRFAHALVCPAVVCHSSHCAPPPRPRLAGRSAAHGGAQREAVERGERRHARLQGTREKENGRREKERKRKATCWTARQYNRGVVTEELRESNVTSHCASKCACSRTPHPALHGPPRARCQF